MVMKGPIRVLMIEDSATIREFLREIIDSDSGLLLIGCADTGARGIEMALNLGPDIIIMDLNLPELDGVEAIRQISDQSAIPILIFSDRSRARNAEKAKEALALGALDIIDKPGLGQFQSAEFRRDFLSKLHVLSGVRPVRRRPVPAPVKPAPAALPPKTRPQTLGAKARAIRVIAIGSSTGGPAAVKTVLAGLPSDGPPILLAQHMTIGFEMDFVKWLNSQAPQSVLLAVSGDKPKAGHVYVSKCDVNLCVTTERVLDYEARPSANSLTSINALFQSVALAYQGEALGVILTGMGRDGTVGLKELHKRQSLTIAQAPATCVIGSMPESAIQAGAISETHDLENIAPRIASLLRR